MKVKKLITAIKEFNGFRYPWNKYGWDTLVYTYFRVPKFKLKLMFKYLKDVEIMSWDMVNCQELIFGMYTMFFEENEEHLKPWLEDGKWQEHKHSENWEGCKGKGSGVKYRDMLEIYMYIKYIRKENEKKKEDLLHLLLSDENYKTWWEDCDEVYDGEKCYLHKHNRLTNFKIDYKYSKNRITDKGIYESLQNMTVTAKTITGYKLKNPSSYMEMSTTLFADNLDINITKLKTTSDKYNKDFDVLYKIENELIELDNEYANKILKIRSYLWT